MELDSDRKWYTWLVTRGAIQCMPRIRFAGLDVVQPGSKYRWDAARHAKYQRSLIFQFTLSGEGRLRYRGRNAALPGGTAFCCDSLTPDLVYYHAEDAARPWTFLFVNLDGAEAVGAELLERFGPVYDLGRASVFVKTIRNYLCGKRQTHFVSAARMIWLVDLMVTELVASGSAGTADGQGGHVVRRACDAIEARMSEALSVRALADELGVSREHLARLFMRELRISPSEQINRVKMRRACVLLEGSRLPIREVAARVGFDNPSHFARVFRRLAGASPRWFREHGQMPLP